MRLFFCFAILGSDMSCQESASKSECIITAGQRWRSIGQFQAQKYGNPSVAEVQVFSLVSK
jgi:hypothetical protein